jgi:putative membrane protein
MTTDAWLAIAHHLAVFGVFAVLMSEWALVLPGMAAADVRRVARVDTGYGALAAVVLAAGASRVVASAKPADSYLENPVLWFKMAAFATVGLLSIRSTLRYLRWRKALDGDDTALPSGPEVSSARRAIRLQLGAFSAIPVFAALMARGIGL